MLYVVATPIGNLGDMSPRAIDTLRRVQVIAAEDTRVTIKLLNHFDIHTPLTSYHQHNEREKSQGLIDQLLAGEDIALVTDAGTPAVSDPGAWLVAQAARQGIEVVTIPGPSAVAAALSVSGFEQPGFAFYGFLPRQGNELAQALQKMAGGMPLAVVYESPHRIIDLLQAVLDALGDIPVSVSCDLTKLHEKTVRGPVSAVLAQLRANAKTAKGEYCAVLDVSGLPPPQVQAVTPAGLEARLVERLLAGDNLRTAMQYVIEQGEKKNAVYAAMLRVKGLMGQDLPMES